ncbi:MAG: hydrolase [Chlamydiota bacterium]|nr:hydrolase [Chlamydiota bacterium]
MKDYEEVLSWIEDQRKPMIDQVIEWADINSGSSNLEGLNAILNTLKRSFETLDAQADTISLRTVKNISPEGKVSESPTGQGLIIQKRPEAQIQVLLGGHMDTVYPLSSPFQKAHVYDNKNIHGPGTADMKGGLMIMLKSLEALEQFKYKEHIGWRVFITPDEEVGSLASEHLHEKFARQSDFGIIFEPSFPDGSIVSARKGSYNFAIISKGKAAHSGRDFHSGKNAIIALLKCCLRINLLNENPNEVTINLGHIEGGGPPNIVPDLAMCRFNVRMKEAEHLNELIKVIEEIIKEENRVDGTDLEFIELGHRTPKSFDQKHADLFDLFKVCAKEHSIDLVCKPSGGVCDGNIWSSAGLPTIDTMGVIGSGIHTFDEQFEVESLIERTKICASLLMKLGSGELQLPESFNQRKMSDKRLTYE